MSWHLLTQAARAAREQKVSELTDDVPGGQACDRCGTRPGLVTWSPLFGRNLCPTCRTVLTDDELKVKPQPDEQVPLRAVQVTDEMDSAVTVIRQEGAA